MAKKAVVKFTGGVGEYLTGLTVGSFYHAHLPEDGEIDSDGLAVRYEDEVWIVADDDGVEVICQISDGFDIAWSEK